MSLAQTERRLAAIMLADIAGYSALMERDEARAFARLQALREQVINPKVAEFGGRIIKTTGDGFLAEFPSATAALGCGITIQRVNFAQEANKDEAERFHLRIGINLGDIIVDGDDVSGDGVNVAARLEPLAPLDGICVSGAVRDQVREDLGVVLEDLGEQQVKNISRPIRAYRINLANVPLAKPARRARPSRKPWIAPLASAALVVLLAVSGLLYWNKTNKPTTPPLSLVVLPFQSVSHDPEQDAFADALTADLTNALGHISGSFVISSNTALTYKGKSIDVRQIGRELSVRYALEGNVQKLGDTVRVNAQMIDAETGGQLWAEQFNGDVTRLAELHDDVKGWIAHSLDIALSIEEGRRSLRQPDNRDAVGLTFQARAINATLKSEKTQTDEAKLLDQALEISPDYPPALILRALVDVSLNLFFGKHIPLDKAERWLSRAMEIEPNNVEAKSAAALLYIAKGDIDRAAAFAEQAIAIDPSFPNSYAILMKVRVFQGRTIESIPLEEKAIRLSPLDPFVDLWYRDLGDAYLLLGKDEEAVHWLEKAVATNDKVWTYHKELAAAYALTGRLDAAHKELEAVARLAPDQVNAPIAKTVAFFRRISSNETFLKQLDHYMAGLRLAGLPEN
jgi:class 3 adenylate cyclase/TolB-like protein